MPAFITALIGVTFACTSSPVPSGGAPPTPAPTPTLIPAPTPAPAKVIFMAGFKAQADLPFVAAYVAQEKGFFEQQKLQVEIKHSSGGGEAARLLAAGEVQFTTSPAEDVMKRIADPGLPFVAIALFGQRGERGWAVLKDSGIKSPKDWEGKTIGYKVFPPPDYLALIKANGIDRSKIKEVNVGFDPRILAEKRVDVYQVFVANEPDILRKLGFDTTVFQAADYGIPTLGLTYVTRADFIESNPDVVERFLKATMRGLQFAYESPQEALDIVMKYAPQEDRAHQKYMMEVEMEAAQSDLTQSKGLGWATPQQWKSLHDSLVEFAAIGKPIDVSAAFTDRFLQRIYKDGKLIWP